MIVSAVLAAALYSLAPLENVTVSPVGTTVTRNPSSVVAARLSDVSPGTLKDAAFALNFAHPTDLRRLAVARAGWGDWAIPKRMAVAVNGGAEQVFDLVSPRLAPNAPGRLFDVDRLALSDAAAVTGLVVRVVEVETKVNRHGALKLYLAEGPIVGCRVQGDPAKTGVKVTVQASAPVPSAELSVGLYRFRKDVRFMRRLPPLGAGRTTLELKWTEFVCTEDPSLVLNPVNVTSLELRADQPGLDVSLEAETCGAAGGVSPLLDLPPCDAPADAEGWRPAIPSDGFGRFGWLEDGNGLLTCSLEEESFFCTARGAGHHMRWCFGNGGRQNRVWRRSTACSTALFTERLMRFEGETGQAVASKAFGVFDASRLPERRIAGILAPGFLLDSHDRVFTLAPEATRGKLFLLMPTAGGLVWQTGDMVDLAPLSEGWVALVCEKMAAVPAVIAFERRPLKAVREGRGYGFVFAGERGRLGVAPACGYEPWTGEPGRTDAASATLARAARRQAELLRNYPIRCDMRFRDEGDAILFEERPAFLRWTNAWGESGVPTVPCPPLVAFAADLGYPVNFPDGKPERAGADTRFGPYRGWSADRVDAARYRLKKGPKDLTLYPRPANAAQADHIAAAMLKKFDERKKGPGERADALGGWFLFASAATAQTLWSNGQREQFAAIWAPYAKLIPDDRVWHLRREPFSGKTYPISFAWTDKAQGILGDANSGIGGALSGLDGYARLTGDWAFIRANWPRIRRIPLYFLYGHDWTMLQTGAREHTAGSAIDMDVITYEGTAALVRMAETVGDRDVAALAEMLLSRYALSFVCKFSAGAWKTPEVPRRDWREYGVGFNEQFGFDMMGPARGEPNLVNSEIALCLAWIGHFPEVFRLAVERGGADLWRDFESAFVENVLVDWRKRHPGRRNCHHANVTPHLELRLMLGESREKIAGELEAQKLFLPDPYAAAECAGFYAYWLGGHAPVTLESFAPAKLLSFVWDEPKGTVRAEFESAEPFRPRVTVTGKPTRAPDLSRPLPKGRTTLEWAWTKD